MWRLAFAKLFGCRVCVMESSSGRYYWRFVHLNPHGDFICRVVGRDWVRLNGDGTVTGKSYLKHWRFA